MVDKIYDVSNKKTEPLHKTILLRSHSLLSTCLHTLASRKQ